MTAEELIKQLEQIKTSGDTEGGHMEADDLLLKYINGNAVTLAFKAIPKWYS